MRRRLPVIPSPDAAGDEPSEAVKSEPEETAPLGPELPTLPLRSVRRMTRPSVPTLRRMARAGLPLVIQGALEDCAAVGRWTPEYLREHAGSLRSKAYVVPDGQVRLDARTGFQLREIGLADYAADVIAGRRPEGYFRAPLDRLPDELRRQWVDPEYCRGGLRLRRNLWFSAQDTVSRLHFDLPNNLIAQVSGAKRFLLYPFGEYRNLYPFPPWSSVPHLSRVDLGAPDFRRFPRLPLAQGWHCELSEGDMLFMPGRMWHYALSLGPSVTVNHWWSSVATLPFSVASDLYKRLRGLNI
ncbi:MAG: cupin-like domain-containing protein [Myxococcota bacterium]